MYKYGRDANRSEYRIRTAAPPILIRRRLFFPPKKVQRNLTSRQLLGLRLLVFHLLHLDNALNPVGVLGHVRVYRRLSGHAALSESVADHAVGHPPRVLAVKVHQRSSGVACTRILGKLPAGADLLGPQTHSEGLQNLGAVLFGDVGNAQLQLDGTVDVDEVFVD